MLTYGVQSTTSSYGQVLIDVESFRDIDALRPVIDTQNARRLGLTQGDISSAIYAHLNGTSIGVYREGEELNDIIMRPFAMDRDDLADLRNIQVFSQVTGGYIPISQVVSDFQLVFEASSLRRIDRVLAITAQSDNASGVRVGDLFDDVRQPLVIWQTVPLTLTGMLIKDAIVLIDETDSRIGSGKALMQAVADAAVSRVRPVALGVITTALATADRNPSLL